MAYTNAKGRETAAELALRVEAAGLDDPLWGVKEIACAVKRSERTTYWMLSQKQIPATRVGDRWVTTKRQIAEAFTVKPAQAA